VPAETLRLDCSTQWSLSTDVVRLGYWRCSGATAITSERDQPWPMISFCYGGAYVVTTDDSRCVVDCSTLLLLNHRRAYKTEAISSEQAYGTSLSVPVEALADVLTQSKSAAAASNGPAFMRVLARLDPGLRMEEGQIFKWLQNPGVFPNLAIEERALRLFAAAIIDAAPDDSDVSSKRRLATLGRRSYCCREDRPRRPFSRPLESRSGRGQDRNFAVPLMSRISVSDRHVTSSVRYFFAPICGAGMPQ
jgi:hypothetical protein